MIRSPALILAAFAFALPASPVLVADSSLMIAGGCGDRSLSITIPFDRPAAPPDEGGSCCDSAACHVGCERQKQRPRRS